MGVDKIESAEFITIGENNSNTIIDIRIMEKWSPILIDTSYCNRITIWWDCNSGEYDPAVKIYAIEEIEDGRDFINKVQTYYDLEIEKAMKYVAENV